MGAVTAGIGDAMGMGGKGGFGQPSQDYQQTQATQNNPNLGIGFGMPAPVGIQGNQPAPDTLPSSGMGGGKGMFSNIDSIAQQFNPNVNKGFGPAPIEQNPMNDFIFGNERFGFGSPTQPMPQPAPGVFGNERFGFGAPSPVDRSQIGNAQIGFGPAPTNRFAPPNAPGVRQQPQTAPRAGVPVQSARTVQPNRFTRTRRR